LEEDEQDYHPRCAKQFFGNAQAPQLTFALDNIEQLAKQSIEHSIAVPGVQPKLSLGWEKPASNNEHQNRLTIMNVDGNYILKPPVKIYLQMPENEHLSMKLAALFGIDIVPVNLIRLASGELCFITKRIDRNNDGSKNHMIDFMQILELEDKYKGSMEQLGTRIGELSVNTLLDKLRFFELTVFNYLIGNNDMHLKNFSMFLSSLGWVLSPAYDLINVKMILPEDKEETALLLGGKKFNFNKSYFTRFAAQLKLNEKQLQSVYTRIQKWLPKAVDLIDISFLTEERRTEYKKMISERQQLLQ
jgi:serine/threonine-protein kinase HipA